MKDIRFIISADYQEHKYNIFKNGSYYNHGEGYQLPVQSYMEKCKNLWIVQRGGLVDIRCDYFSPVRLDDIVIAVSRQMFGQYKLIKCTQKNMIQEMLGLWTKEILKTSDVNHYYQRVEQCVL